MELQKRPLASKAAIASALTSVPANICLYKTVSNFNAAELNLVLQNCLSVFTKPTIKEVISAKYKFAATKYLQLQFWKCDSDLQRCSTESSCLTWT